MYSCFLDSIVNYVASVWKQVKTRALRAHTPCIHLHWWDCMAVYCTYFLWHSAICYALYTGTSILIEAFNSTSCMLLINYIDWSACFLLLLGSLTEEVTPLPLSYHLLATLIFSGIKPSDVYAHFMHTHK